VAVTTTAPRWLNLDAISTPTAIAERRSLADEGHALLEPPRSVGTEGRTAHAR
jgi:hypothetical protein